MDPIVDGTVLHWDEKNELDDNFYDHEQWRINISLNGF